jgi:hypothetical protein
VRASASSRLRSDRREPMPTRNAGWGRSEQNASIGGSFSVVAIPSGSFGSTPATTTNSAQGVVDETVTTAA